MKKIALLMLCIGFLGTNSYAEPPSVEAFAKVGIKIIDSEATDIRMVRSLDPIKYLSRALAFIDEFSQQFNDRVAVQRFYRVKFLNYLKDTQDCTLMIQKSVCYRDDQADVGVSACNMSDLNPKNSSKTERIVFVDLSIQ